MTARGRRWSKKIREVEIGAFSFLGDPHVVESMVGAGLDWVCLDSQHGRFDDAGVRHAVELAAGGPARLVVRVRALDSGLIGRALDAGSEGVVVPMIETSEQAREAVRSTFYPPLGSRSFGPIRSAYGDPADTASANGNILCAVMIETRTAIDNVDEIAATPGVDMLFVGPFDLALALGTTVDRLLADESDGNPLGRIVQAADAVGVSVGAFAGTVDRAVRLVERGFMFVAATGDAAALGIGLSIVIDGARQSAAGNGGLSPVPVGGTGIPSSAAHS